MASTASVAVGQRIRDARDRAGLTQAELANAIQVDRSVVTKIETGSRRVSALELARVAEALEERIEWFVEDGPPAIVSRRNLRDAGAPSPAIDKLVERIARSVEFVADHDRQLLLASAPPLDRPRSNKAVEEVAAEVRARLDFDDAAPLLDLSAHAASVA
jgi:transcriptional regulator with XRE-family HTH domain